MFILKVIDNGDWMFATRYYEYDDESRVLEVSRNLAAKGVECVVYKPYKKFEIPVPEVKEVSL